MEVFPSFMIHYTCGLVVAYTLYSELSKGYGPAGKLVPTGPTHTHATDGLVFTGFSPVAAK